MWRQRFRRDPVDVLVDSGHDVVMRRARWDLLDERAEPLRELWVLPEVERIVARQLPDGRWRYSGGNERVRSRADYDQLETYRQLAVLVAKYRMDRRHPAVVGAVGFLETFQSDAGDFRGIYGNQYSPNYTAAIAELMIRTGHGRGDAVDRALRWLVSMRQHDGGWAIPTRTLDLPLSVMATDTTTYEPDRSRPSAHLVTGIVLRALAAHPGRSPAEAAEAEVLRARLAPLVAPGARIDLDFTAPLAPSWRLVRPASLRRDPSRGALELTLAADSVPVAELPIVWSGGPLAVEYELDLERLEYGACLRLGFVDRDGEFWLGAGVCAIGGGGRLLHIDRCQLGGTGWSEFTEEVVPSSVFARRLVVRFAAFPDGTAECSFEDGARSRRAAHTGAAMPLLGPQRLAIGAFTDAAGPNLAQGSLIRVTVHGAAAAPAADEPDPRAAAARHFVEGEPAAALAALDEVVVGEPRDALLRMLAETELRDPAGLARATAQLLPHLHDPGWRADLALLLRTRPAAAMALYDAAGAGLLPALALTWAVVGPHVRDPDLQRSALAELVGIEQLAPRSPDERSALRRLLVLRGRIRGQLGHVAQARRDLEVALAVPAAALPGDLDERVDAHVQLARLLVVDDPAAARAHAAAALAASPRPELVADRLAAIAGL